eukprot:2294208-Rhodomonas_salina.1
MTAHARLGSTDAEVSMWLADTAVVCFHSRGFGGTARSAVTVGRAPGTTSEAASYDQPIANGILT